LTIFSKEKRNVGILDDQTGASRKSARIDRDGIVEGFQGLGVQGLFHTPSMNSRFKIDFYLEH
jgi:hypothetical protein